MKHFCVYSFVVVVVTQFQPGRPWTSFTYILMIQSKLTLDIQLKGESLTDLVSI
jgi:hypothetical protein